MKMRSKGNYTESLYNFGYAPSSTNIWGYHQPRRDRIEYGETQLPKAYMKQESEPTDYMERPAPPSPYTKSTRHPDKDY